MPRTSCSCALSLVALLALVAAAQAQWPGQQLPGAQPRPGNPFPWQPGGAGFQGHRPGRLADPAGMRLHRPVPAPPRWDNEEHKRRQMALDAARHAGHASHLALGHRHGRTYSPPKASVPAGGSSWWKPLRSTGGKGWLAGIGAAIVGGVAALFRRRSG